MRYLSPCILVGCLLVSGCGTLPPYEPDQSLRGITAPPPIARNLDERQIGRTNFPGEAQERDESYKQLFDYQITLEETDFNDSEDAQEFLERIPEKLRPLVVRELVQKALRDKRDARQREASKRDNRRSKALNPNRVSEHSPAWTDPDPKQRFSRMRRQGRERDFNQGNYYEDVALDSPERSERQERQQYGDEWEIEVAQAIKTLEQLLSDKGIDEEERSRGETCLRLLQVIAGDTESAVSPIPKLNSTQQDFWKHLVHALSVLLDQRNNPLHDQRAALALPGLRKAVEQLAKTSALEVRNVAFCYEVDSYGQYKEFAKYQFKPNDQALLYAEIDNFSAVQTNRGEWETELSGSYQIYDQQGNKVAERNFPVETEVCRNRRRDFFIPYRVYIPKVSPGRYNLQLTMRDVKSKKTGQSAMIEFTVTE